MTDTDEDFDMDTSSDDNDDDMFNFFSGGTERANTGDLISTETSISEPSRGTDITEQWQRVSLVGPEDIRIFSIEPAKFETETVYCAFRQTSLTQPDEYFALSYVWGKTSDDGSHLTDTIYCDGFPVQVTPTLHQALRRMRQMQSIADEATSFKIPALWVDALCIDQSSVIERGRQVMLMGRIFGSARHLVVWLGEPDRLGHGQHDFVEDKVRETHHPLPLRGHDPLVTDDLSAIGRALQCRPFFERRWVIQEAVLSPQPQSILVGQHRFLSTNLPTTLRDQNLELELHDITSGPTQAAENTASAEEITKRCLMEHLVDFHLFKCSDDRDRVYALRDISSDGRHLKIDYRMPTNEVYTALAVHWVRLGNVLPVLIASVHRQRPLDWYPGSTEALLPFWVPDWRIPPATRTDLGNALPDQFFHEGGTDEEFAAIKAANDMLNTSTLFSEVKLQDLTTTKLFQGREVTHPDLLKPILALSIHGVVFRRCHLHHGSTRLRKVSCPWCFFSKHAPLEYPSEFDKPLVLGQSLEFNEVFCFVEDGWILGLQPSPYEDEELQSPVFRVRTVSGTRELLYKSGVRIHVDGEGDARDFVFEEILIC